jgi:threonine/homoserine/homoserine lactone efflux protein
VVEQDLDTAPESLLRLPFLSAVPHFIRKQVEHSKVSVTLILFMFNVVTWVGYSEEALN